jgi:hypothetical protein
VCAMRRTIRLSLIAGMLALATSVMAQVASLNQNDGRSSTWDFSGSSVALFAHGNQREFRYDVPRPGMAEEGVRAGTLLFKGRVINGQYAGRAYMFSKKCGSVPYEVSGLISSDYRNVTMYGKGPRLDPVTCQTVSYRDNVLVFDYRQPAPPPVIIAQPAPPSSPEMAGPLRAENAQLRQQLAQTQESASNALARASIAESTIAVLRERLRNQEGRSTVIEKPVYIEKPVRVEVPSSRTAIDSLIPSIAVMTISLALQFIKNKLKVGLPTGREIAIESIAAFFSSFLMYQLGASSEITLFAIPFIGGLFSMAFMMRIKHLADDLHHHHNPAFA